MTRSGRGALLPVLLLALAGCGPLRPRAPEPSPGVVMEADSALALESQVRQLGMFPTAGDIAEGAVLYTEMQRVPGTRTYALTRDTIRGGEAVARRLQARQVRSLVPFELNTQRVFRCEGGALQYGVYPVDARVSDRVVVAPQTQPGDRAVWAPFAARWRAGEDGDLKLDALWLGPLDLEVRVGRLGHRCRDTDVPVFARDYAGRRTGLEFGVGYPFQLSTTGFMEDAVRDHGWNTNVASAVSPSLALSGFYRLRSGIQLMGVATYQLPAQVQATGDVFDATLEWSGGTVAGLLAGELGRFRIGAGPAVAFTHWQWSDHVFSAVFEPGAPSSGTTVVPGGVAELDYIQTLRSRLYLSVRGRYAYFMDAEVPGFRTFPATQAPMDRTSVTVGLGYWW